MGPYTVKCDIYRIPVITRENMMERKRQSFIKITPKGVHKVRRFRNSLDVCFTPRLIKYFVGFLI